MFATLAADEVQVTFRETAALDQSAIGAAADLLSEEERTRCARFMFARDRRDFAIAHALLRQTLSRHHPIPPREWTFVPEPHGKPRISADLTTAADLHFNIAHTHGLVACAVSRGADVGIDVEEIERRSDPLEIASRYFSVIETEDLKHQGDREGAVVAAGRVHVPVRGPVGSAVHGRNLRSNGVVVCAICTNAWTPDGRRGETRGHAGPTEDHLAERRSWTA